MKSHLQTCVACVYDVLHGALVIKLRVREIIKSLVLHSVVLLYVDG